MSLMREAATLEFVMNSYDRTIRGCLLTALRKTIADHGAVDLNLFSSLDKRFKGELKSKRHNLLKSYLSSIVRDDNAQLEPTEL